ncbi:MAG: L,D-transpeptidase family protein [Hyphomicrobiaceae bacterium]
MSDSVALCRRLSWSTAAVFGATAASSLALLAALGPVDSALAQQSRPKPVQAAKPSPAVAQTQGPYIAVISIANQKLTLYNRHGVVATSPVSTGRSGYETPQGVFSIIERKEEHFSNIYDDASMPFMQRITWSGVAMHAGALPGYPASHGCIRLPHSFAERLFGITKLNTRVVVAPRDVAPVAISHAALFQPSLPGAPPVAAAPATVVPAPTPAAPRSSEPLKSDETPMMLGLKPQKPDVPEAAPSPMAPQRAVTSLVEAARLQRAAANERAATAIKAADQARLVVKTKLVEARKAEVAHKKSDALLRRAEARVEAADRVVTLAKTDEALEKAKLALEKATQDLAELRKATDELKVLTDARGAEAREAADAVKAADAVRNAAQAEAREAARREEPISVFVSRRTSRLYVRQGRQPVFDMAVTLKQPNKPIGTHIFTAIDELPAQRGVQWNVVTVETGVPEPTPPPQSKRRGQPVVEAPRPPARNWAAEALDRLEIPQEALDRITPYLQVGSSLLISDLGPSIEQGKGTDFVVLTKGEEQAAESIARFVAEKKKELAEQRRYGNGNGGTRRN